MVDDIRFGPFYRITQKMAVIFLKLLITTKLQQLTFLIVAFNRNNSQLNMIFQRIIIFGEGHLLDQNLHFKLKLAII